MDKSDNILANQRRIDVFEFDINHEIKELIKWYSNRINMEYGTVRPVAFLGRAGAQR